MRPSLFNTLVRAFLLLSTLTLSAENWPGWRGPRGDGSSLDENAPLSWNVKDNLLWKVALPGEGHASPIIWENAVYLVAADPETEGRFLLKLDARNGKVLWTKTVLKAPLENIHRRNSRASSTPATDGDAIYVSFLDGDSMYIAAFDMEGNRLWERRPGRFSSIHGYCSSPVLWKGLVILNGDHDGEAYLVALDRKTGETVWKTPRPNNTRSYCTPIIRAIDGRNQLILSGNLCVASYNPDTGEQHWISDGPTEQFVASLVYNGRYLFMTCGFPERLVQAIDPRGSGNVTKSHVIWNNFRDASYVPSPLAIGDYFLVVSDRGKATCFEADTGDTLWNERIGREHNASPVSLRGHACFISESGDMSVIKAGPDFEISSLNILGETVHASPAIANGRWYIRSEQHLYCIGR